MDQKIAWVVDRRPFQGVGVEGLSLLIVHFAGNSFSSSM
jgi:hypothetical protein